MSDEEHGWGYSVGYLIGLILMAVFAASAVAIVLGMAVLVWAFVLRQIGG